MTSTSAFGGGGAFAGEAAISTGAIRGCAGRFLPLNPSQDPLGGRPILNHIKRGGLVYDPFLGSGTTLAPRFRPGCAIFSRTRGKGGTMDSGPQKAKGRAGEFHPVRADQEVAHGHGRVGTKRARENGVAGRWHQPASSFKRRPAYRGESERLGRGRLWLFLWQPFL